jgi:hypothetical protein
MDQLIINNNIKYDTIKNLVLTKDFYIVFSNEKGRSGKATVDKKATLDSLFTPGVIDLVFVAKVDKTKEVEEEIELWLAAPNSNATEPTKEGFPAGYNFFNITDGTAEGTTKDITTLFFRKTIEANFYTPTFNTLSLVYCEKDKDPLLGENYDFTAPDPENPPAQPDENPFIDPSTATEEEKYNFRILAQVHPAPLNMNKSIEVAEGSPEAAEAKPPKLELLIEF